MRRRLEILIPIVLLAVLVQMMAPIGAFRAVASMVSDPLAMASICSEMASAADVETAPSDAPHHQGNCCAFCAVGHAVAAAIDAPPLTYVTLQRQYQRVVWLQGIDATPAIRVGSNAQARAPPVLS